MISISLTPRGTDLLGIGALGATEQFPTLRDFPERNTSDNVKKPCSKHAKNASDNRIGPDFEAQRRFSLICS